MITKSAKNKTINKALAKNLKAYRENSNYSIELLAKVLSVKSSVVLAWEKGKTLPPLNIIIDLATIYKVPIDSLLGLKNFGRTVTTLEPLKDGEMTVNEKELFVKFRLLNEGLKDFILVAVDMSLEKAYVDEEKFNLRKNRFMELLNEQGDLK